MKKIEIRPSDSVGIGEPNLQVTAIDRTPVNRVFAELRWVPLVALENLDLLDGDMELARALRTGSIATVPTAEA